MKTHPVRKALIPVGLLCLSFLLPATAFSWNQATHAYISDRVGARAGPDNVREIWGSVTPDFFNYIFDPAVCPGWISDQTHGMDGDTFLKVWDAASSQEEEALAYGFVTHNEPWGADHIAHDASLTLDKDEGYVIFKAKVLLDTPVDPASPHPTFGEIFTDRFGMDPDEALLAAHGITEYAIDIRLGNEVDPLLGQKLETAAGEETKGFADLLVKAYAEDYAAACFEGDTAKAASILREAEKKHREDMVYVGQAILQPEPVAVQLMAEELATVLSDLLGGPLPEDALQVLEKALRTSMTLCEEYREEVDGTVDFVDKNLTDRGIVYEVSGPQEVPQEFVECTGWHALCTTATDCQIDGEVAYCDCLRVNEPHIVETDAIQDPEILRQTRAQCTNEHPCERDEAPVCKAIEDGTYEVDNVRYSWISTFSYRGWCSLFEPEPVPCDQKEPGYTGDSYWAVCDGAPCTENPDPFDPERPLTCQCRGEESPFVGTNGSCTGDRGGIMSSSPLWTWDFEASTYRIAVPGLEYVQSACAQLASDPVAEECRTE